MGTIKKSGRTVVGVSLNAAEIAQLEAQREQLGAATNSGALRLLWQHLGDDAASHIQQQQAVAASASQTLAPLVEALERMSDALDAATHQRRKVGVNANQVAQLANVLRIDAREHRPVDDEIVTDLVLVLQGIERRLAELAESDHRDDLLRAEVRAALASLRSAA